MSYILDALRKSDQLRRRNAAPTLPLGQATAVAPKRPPLLSYGVLALVLLGAGIAIGWLRPWQPQAPAPVAVAAAPKLPEPRVEPTPAVQPGAALQPQAPTQQPLAPLAPVPARASVPAAVPAPAQAQQPAAPMQKQRLPQQQAAAPVPAAAVSAAVPQEAHGSKAPGGAPPAPAVMTMAELPVAIQQELPPMSISVHAYSGKAADRLVGINGRLLHEGDNVAPGLNLEQITPDGMILSYKGYTFRHGVR
ncbi:MAG: general secretion pathway protein GspB [Burkholderiales bacterium]|jgi:general secretion pathway protein B